VISLSGTEKTFEGRCDLCHKTHRACRNHHLIPQRLLKILPKNSYLRWFKQTIVVCSKCNSYIHPENKLYERINWLENQLGLRQTDYSQKGDTENDSEGRRDNG